MKEQTAANRTGPAKNLLRAYFDANRGALLNKWLHYFDVYDRHFARYRHSDVVMVEVGIYHGGSLGMWKSYFGPRARIVGIDVNPRARKFAGERVDVMIGDQADPCGPVVTTSAASASTS